MSARRHPKCKLSASAAGRDRGEASCASSRVKSSRHSSAKPLQLLRIAYLLTGDRHHAEDLTQTALAKTYRHWRRVLATEDPAAYVRRILINCNNDRFRKRRVSEHLTDTPIEAAWPEDPVAGVDNRRLLLSALAALPPRQRAVVVLRYWEYLPEAEVAQILGCAVGTVKSQAAKASPDCAGIPGWLT